MSNSPDAQAEAQKRLAEGQAYIQETQGKLNVLVHEFTSGEISRDQFQQLYNHYQQKIITVTQFMTEADDTLLEKIASGKTTAMRESLTAQALSLAVYYHTTGLFLATVGDFEVPLPSLSATLHDLSDKIARREPTLPQVMSISDVWLLFVTGAYTTSIMVFNNEPSARQIAVVERMHRDFEATNERTLRSGQADAQTMTYPFEAFVRKSLGMK